MMADPATPHSTSSPDQTPRSEASGSQFSEPPSTNHGLDHPQKQPTPPAIHYEDIRNDLETLPFHYSPRTTLRHFIDAHRVLKAVVQDLDLYLTQAAADCAVRVLGRVLRNDKLGNAHQYGMVMLREASSDMKAFTGADDVTCRRRRGAIYEMVELVTTLHEKQGIVHGDIKADNMLICADGRLRLCDSGDAKENSEDAERWSGKIPVNYEAPGL